MKKIIVTFLNLSFFLIVQAQVSLTINVQTSGTLSNLLTEEQKTTITDLTLTGKINASDFMFMNSKLTKLAVLDISSVKIEYCDHCGSYRTGSINPDPENGIPQFAFYSFNYFGNSTLKSVKLPHSLTTIQESGFYKCSALTSISIPSSVTFIGDDAFSECSSLSGNLIIPNGVTYIGTYAFGACSNLTGNLIIPDAVTSIGNSAFWGCSFNSITISKSIPSIGDMTFGSCNNITDIIIPSSVVSIGYGAFAGCKALTNLDISNSVTSIGDAAFANCGSLKNIKFSEKITNIGYGAFSNCTNIQSITIPNSTTSIGDWAFLSCVNLNSLIIPKSVTSIGDYAFESCTGLTSIYANASIPVNLNSVYGVFKDVNKTTCKLYVPTGSTNAYLSADQWKDFINIEEVATELQPISQSNIKMMTSKGVLIISNAEMGSKVQIYSFLGVKMKEELTENNQTTIYLPTGIYVIRIGNYFDKVVIK